ncbi:MAG: hypothetical protein PHS60_10140 [Zavarzinia sp.]|nr:hypothetical protein [Zavarzinia sp.]
MSAACLIAGTGAGARAEDLVDLSAWNLYGSLSGRSEWFVVTGDKSRSPYFDRDQQGFVEFDGGFERAFGDFESLSGYARGVLSASSYRTLEPGFTLEGARLIWQKGDGVLPFRLETGDIFAFTSTRTALVGLRGFALELQPDLGTPERALSILAFAGVSATDYDALTLDDGFFAGTSFLFSDETDGVVTANAVYHRRGADAAAGLARDIDQTVASVGFTRNFRLFDHHIDLFGEAAHFAGDDVSGQRRNRSDGGWYGELQGRNRDGLFYGISYQRYGNDYRPAAAAVIADHQALESRIGWRFDGGLTVRGRYLDYDDGVATTNPLNTKTYGIGLSGPLARDAWPGLSATLDLFHTRIEDEAGTRDRDTDSFSASVTAPFDNGWSGRFGLRVQDVETRAPTTSHFISRQADAGITIPWTLGDVAGSVTPGAVMRLIDGAGSDSTEYGPRLALSAYGGPHAVDLSLSTYVYDRQEAGTEDLLALQASASYAYSWERHRLGFDISYDGRDPATTERTDTLRIGIFYSVAFQAAGQGYAAVGEVGDLAAAGDIALDFAALSTRASVDDLRRRLAEAGFGTGARVGTLHVYDARLFENVDNLQRFALVERDGAVDRLVAVVELVDPASATEAGRLFQRIEQDLARRYGPPTDAVDEGQFTGGDFQAMVADGTIARVREWQFADGVLRLGIPQRMDGRARIELQFGATMPPIRFKRWSVETLQ